MNEIYLDGQLHNIRTSHTVGSTVFEEAELHCGQYDLRIKFKSVNNTHKDGDEVSIVGSIRSYSYTEDDKFKVQIYVLTEFDTGTGVGNHAEVDGRICRQGNTGKTSKGVPFYKFTLANNILTKEKKFNSYIPCIIYGKKAAEMGKLPVSTVIKTTGYLRSYIAKENELLHEYVIETFEVI